MAILNYNPFDHWTGGNSEPVGPEDANIIGLELEISDVPQRHAHLWDAAIDDGLLETEDSGTAFIQLEREAQDSVEFELVFNADYPENVLDRLIEVNQYIGATFQNDRDTSAHIHLNRAYLEDELELDELDVYRAVEAIAPLIFEVSGRDSRSWTKWCPSNTPAWNTDYLQRLEEVDNCLPNEKDAPFYNNPNTTHNARYELCNVQNDKTIEIRGFSNYCDNDADIIGLFIKIAADLVPAIASVYKGGKSYATNPKPLFKIVEGFIEDNSILNRYDVSGWKNIEGRLITWRRARYDEVIEEYTSFIEDLQRARQCSSYDPIRSARHILDALETIKELTPAALDLEDLTSTINDLESAAQKRFKNKVWRL